MDLAYFEANVPVTKEIVNIIIVAGWAILIGNLVFQAMKSMMSGIGFEGEDPKILFCRTFVFGFLLLASRQICEIGLGMTSQLNTMLKTPDGNQIAAGSQCAPSCRLPAHHRSDKEQIATVEFFNFKGTLRDNKNPLTMYPMA